MSADLYEQHSRLLRQMARHIELCTTLEHRRANGDRASVSSNDTELVITLFKSIYGHPAGGDIARRLALGLQPGQERNSKLLDIVSINVASSEYDETITYEFTAFPSKELQTTKLFKDAADYAKRRADSYMRVIAPPTRAPLQMER